MKLINTVDAVGHVLCHDMTRIIPGQEKGPVFRKGHVVTEADIPNTGPDDGLIRMETLMRIRRLKFFDGHLLNRNLLKKYGFTNFRGPRYMSQELKEKIIELYGPIDPDDSVNP